MLEASFRNANLSKYQINQTILPKKYFVTDLIIKYFYENHLHSGTRLTISAIWQKIWIFNAKEAVTRNIRRCMKCFWDVSNLLSHFIGDVSSARVTPARELSRFSADLAGPFLVKPRKSSGVKIFKLFVCLYILFATKAIHLEVLEVILQLKLYLLHWNDL